MVETCKIKLRHIILLCKLPHTNLKLQAYNFNNVDRYKKKLVNTQITYMSWLFLVKFTLLLTILFITTKMFSIKEAETVIHITVG